MKFRLLVPILVFALSASAETVKTLSPTEEALRQAVADRMDYIEHRYGVRFDREMLCSVTFGMPDGDTPIRAEYVSGERAIYINQKFTLQFLAIQYYMGEHAFEGAPELNWDSELMVLLDHELGHALADQVSRRIGNGIWPDGKERAKLVWHKRYGVKILSEGVGQSFGYIAYAEEGMKGEKSLPKKSNEEYWKSWEGLDSFYDGGYYLVEPIIRNFGERGIIYIVTHPFDFPDGRARQAAKEYQKKAFAEIGKKGKK